MCYMDKPMSETTLLEKCLVYLKQSTDVMVPPGDDCAVLQPSIKYEVVTADPVIESIHFLPDTPPEAIARKLMRRNLSDIAAMGAIPRYGVLTVACHHVDQDDFLIRFFKTMGKESTLFSCPIVGGDLTRLPMPGLVATLFISGVTDTPLLALRAGAKVGDYIAVTGPLGNSFHSGHHLNFEPRLKEGQSLVQSGAVHAMMDISDGLLMDLNRICVASNCGAQLNLEHLPLRSGATLNDALNEGEDYELLFTFDVSLSENISIPYTVIGKIIASHILIDAQGQVLHMKGWDPFKNDPPSSK